MRVVFPERHEHGYYEPSEPTLICGTITTLESERESKKKGKKKKHRTAPLGFQPPKTHRRKGK